MSDASAVSASTRTNPVACLITCHTSCELQYQHWELVFSRATLIKTLTLTLTLTLRGSPNQLIMGMGTVTTN